tara:strand:- start:659 stop:1144 length:486 start_codon:yes stop_codon:yes gene_type:complete
MKQPDSDPIHLFMKRDETILPPKLPFQTNGLGQLCHSDTWSSPIMTIQGHPNHIPRRPTMSSAGFSLYATNDGCITARGSTTFSTGISVNIPFGHFGRIEGFSTLYEKLLVPIPLIIDENNPDIIDICLLNHSNKIHQIKKGDCIGQLIIARYVVPRVLLR